MLSKGKATCYIYSEILNVIRLYDPSSYRSPARVKRDATTRSLLKLPTRQGLYLSRPAHWSHVLKVEIPTHTYAALHQSWLQRLARGARNVI
jgi:hypothetical protein